MNPLEGLGIAQALFKVAVGLEALAAAVGILSVVWLFGLWCAMRGALPISRPRGERPEDGRDPSFYRPPR